MTFVMWAKTMPPLFTYKRDDSDNANNMYYLNRLNLKTLQVEPEIISVKAAGTHILGVLADGALSFGITLIIGFNQKAWQ